MRIPSDTGDEAIDLLLSAKPLPPDLLAEGLDLWCQQTNYGRHLTRRAPPVERKDYGKMLQYRPRATDRDLTLRFLLSTLPDGGGWTYHAYLLNVPGLGSLFLAKTWATPTGEETNTRRRADAAAPGEVDEFLAAARDLQLRRRARDGRDVAGVGPEEADTGVVQPTEERTRE